MDEMHKTPGEATIRRMGHYAEVIADLQDEQRRRFADALGYYINKFGKTQRDIAKHLGVSEATVSNWIAGVKMPRPQRIHALADYFGVTYQDMLAISAQEDFADLEEPQPGIVEEVDSLMRKIEKAPRPLIYGGNEIPDNIVVLLKDVLNIIQGK